jgi:hypothetical protein
MVGIVRTEEKRDIGVRWLGPETESGTETATAAVRYMGINVTLYGNGEAVGLNRSASNGTRGGSVYFGKDILGSVRGISNEYGVLEDRYEYDAFGKPYKGDFSTLYPAINVEREYNDILEMIICIRLIHTSKAPPRLPPS